MKKYIAILLTISAFCCSAVSAAESKSENAGMAVSGTWVTGPNSGSNFGWQKSGTQLNFMVGPELTNSPYKITRTEPLPKGDYTIDMWVQTVGVYDTISLCIGDPKTNHNRPVVIVSSTMNKGLPLRWIRLGCSPARDMVVISINGRSNAISASDAGVQFNGQFSLVVQSSRWDTSNQEALRVISCSVTPGAGAEFGTAGPAFLGWSTKINPGNLEDISVIGPQMDAIYDSAKTDAGKSYALAARILSEYGCKGIVSEDTWTRLSSLVEELLIRERSGLAIVLPIAAACADTKQKEQIKVWINKFFAVSDLSQWQNLKITSDAEEKAILLDPVAAVRMGQHMSHRNIGYWTQALKQTSPQFAPMAIMSYLDNEEWKTQVIAWMLPEILTASTRLGKNAIDVVKESAKEKSPQPGEPDKRLSFAAYRLARVDPASSVEFLSMIKDPEVKADTIYYIGKALSENDSIDPVMVESIEKLMRQSIIEWKPTKLRGSPVEVMMRLVRFLDSQKQTQKAAELLAETATKTDESSADASRDTVDIARYKRQTKSADSQIWWDKAISIALTADQERGMPDNAEGMYISGLTTMARDLVKENKLNEAITLVKMMDMQLMKNNRAMALDSIIVQTLKTDIDSAISLLKEYPDMRAKYGIIGVIAAKIALNDLPKALDLLKTIPASSRTTALLRIASVLPVSKLSSILAEIKESITSGIKPPTAGSFTWGFGNDSVSKYASLPISNLLALTDAFNQSPDLLAVYLLASAVKHCELENDPIWIQYWGSKRSDGNGAMIPWGSGKLRYAVEGE